MPAPAVPSQLRGTSQIPGYHSLSSRLGDDRNTPLAAWSFSDSFVSHTNKPMMQTQGEKNYSGTVRNVIFARHKGMIIMIY